MKKLIYLFMTVAITVTAFAETKFPRGTFQSSELDKAKEQAASTKKGIAFIYTNKDTTCGLSLNAAAAFIDAVKSKTVIVYLDSSNSAPYWANLSPPVREGLIAGKFIPKIVVTDATGENVIAALTYEEFKTDSRGSIRKMKKDMRAK